MACESRGHGPGARGLPALDQLEDVALGVRDARDAAVGGLLDRALGLDARARQLRQPAVERPTSNPARSAGFSPAPSARSASAASRVPNCTQRSAAVAALMPSVFS
jgi:hypothetical protein